MVEEGALILVCRSSEFDNFAWFKNKILAELKLTHDNRVTVLDVHTSAQLHEYLLSCPAHHDVSEIHLFVEFQADTLVVSSSASEFVSLAGAPQRTTVPAITVAKYLPHATCKIWFWANGDQPGFTVLKDFARHFGHHCFLLPLGQLKKRGAKRPRRTSTARVVPLKEKLETKRSPILSEPLLRNSVVWLLIIGFSYSFFYDQAPDYSGSYDEVIRYSDSSYDIDVMTVGMQDKGGELAKHTWVYDKKKWDYEWFIADEWLKSANAELASAAKSNAGSSHEYWRYVYNQLLEKNQYRLVSVAKSLKREAVRRNYDRYELASLTLAFVQHIPYKIPSNQLELLTPPTTLSKRYGDCDTKSLLYVLIMQQLEFDVSLYVSNRYRHAMAGININAMGSYKSHEGRRYYFVETTAVGHRIGQLVTGNGLLNSWYLIPLENKASSRSNAS